MKKVVIFTLLAASAWVVRGADDVQLALTLRAQTDFDRVILSGAPMLRDATACIQSEAALAPVAGPEDQPIVHFRKGYCMLAEAGITRDVSAWQAAAAEFDRALSVWPVRVAALMRKKLPMEPAPSAYRVLAEIARLEANDSAGQGALAGAIDAHACPAGAVSAGLCEEILGIGRQWLGWRALLLGDLDTAARDFAGVPGWTSWVAGRQAFRSARYSEAAADDQWAIADWSAVRRQEPSPMMARIAPPVDLSTAYTELGGAQMLAGNPTAAIASFTQAVKERSANAQALYLRGRAEEIAGRAEAAQSDYSMASRVAFANATDLATGEAHLYRGILLYRRSRYSEAEDEFSSALSFEIAPPMRADAGAWRRLAAVKTGACEASRAALQQALPTVSPYFPKDEARTAMAACSGGPARE